MHKAIEEIYKANLIPHHGRYMGKAEELSDGVRVTLQLCQWDAHGVELWQSYLDFVDGEIVTQWNVNREWQ